MAREDDAIDRAVRMLMGEAAPSRCDVCNGNVTSPNGYLLTTTQVVGTPGYWRRYFQMHRHELASYGVTSYEAFCRHPVLASSCGSALCAQRTPWLVCDGCIALFAVPRETARRYAEQWWNSGQTLRPPGTGAAPASAIRLVGREEPIPSAEPDALEALTRSLLSEDPAELDRAVARARRLAKGGDRTGQLALEEAIRRKSGNPHCRFYTPGVRSFSAAEAEEGLAELWKLASGRRLLEDPARAQGLIALVRLAAQGGLLRTTLQDLMMEIGNAAGKEQRDAFQLLATHSVVLAELIGKARGTPPEKVREEVRPGRDKGGSDPGARTAPPAVTPPQQAGNRPPPAGQQITFRCPHCSKLAAAPAGAAGQTGKCPACGTALRIPGPGAAPGSANPPPDSFRFKCHACGSLLQVPFAHSGKTSACGTCKTRLTVPPRVAEQVRMLEQLKGSAYELEDVAPGAFVSLSVPFVRKLLVALDVREGATDSFPVGTRRVSVPRTRTLEVTADRTNTLPSLSGGRSEGHLILRFRLCFVRGKSGGVYCGGDDREKGGMLAAAEVRSVLDTILQRVDSGPIVRDRSEPVPSDHAPPAAPKREEDRPAAGPAPKRQKVVVLTDEEMALVRQYGHDRLADAARDLAEAGRFRESFLCCHVLVKTHPDEATFWRQCGVALYQMDEAVWRRQPNGPLPYTNAQQAITYFDKALQRDDQDHLTWYLKGMCVATIGSIRQSKAEVKAGLECLEKALRLSGGDPRILQSKLRYETVYRTMGGGSFRLDELGSGW